jgi:hypothetical protein
VNEHELERLAAQLGERQAERLDVEAVAGAVAERLRQSPEVSRTRWAPPEWLRIAATLVMLLGAGAVLQRVSPPLVQEYALDDLRDLTTSELAQLLASLESTLADDDHDATSLELEGLTPAQLQTLLRSLET